MSADEQIERLHAVARERDRTVAKAFTERPATVKKDWRSGESALIEAIGSGTVEQVLIFGIDRIGRFIGRSGHFHGSMPDGWRIAMAGRTAVGYRWIEWSADIRRDGDDGAPSAPEPPGSDFAWSGEARSLSIRFGRPPIAKAKVEKARIALTAGKGVREAARLAGISATSLSRLKNSMGAALATAWTELPPIVAGRLPHPLW
jgi:DNA invertase Pin-like site-specific DNA recombinase